MAENLVIVESPAKAKTIGRFLGSNYIVKSSFGHIRDLSKKELGIDIQNNFTPHYEVSADKKKIVSELKKQVKDAKTIWLASDEDREGEAIAWHLAEVLKLNPSTTKRIVFHEITKDAILHSIKNPRTIDTKLVDAQQARRILDRIVGFELSPVLWRKVRPSLSAGRVQSVAVRIIVEREREIINFVPQASFRILGTFSAESSSTGSEFQAELNKRFETEEEVVSFLESVKNNTYIINNCENKPGKRSPAAPFTTSTLQQEASRKLGFPVAKTMSIAQKLYEEGHITYMRTDSVNLSGTAIHSIKEFIISKFGDEFSKVRKYTTKSKGAQEAHEAIRPTYIQNEKISNNSDEQRLYELIRKRTIASQMADAQLARTTFTIHCDTRKNLYFEAKGEVVTFEGFLKMYIESSDDETDSDNSKLPALQIGAKLNSEKIVATQRYSNYPARYTEASLVKKLEELGIGRPSTYAPTISTIQKRGYIEKDNRVGEKKEVLIIELLNKTIKKQKKTETYGSEKSKLFPTDIGFVVTDFLLKNFNNVLEYSFTAKVEEQFDKIAEGEIEWQNMITQFYDTFHNTIETVIEESERGDGERILGTDPKTNKDVMVRIGRFGPVIQLGATGEDEKPVFKSLPKGVLLETITFDEAIEILYSTTDDSIGTDPKTNKNIYVKSGKFGPYIQLGEQDDKEKKYVSLPKGLQIEQVTLEKALHLLKLPRLLGDYENEKVQVNNGRFGPYIAHKSKFISLKKGDPDLYEITLEEAIQCIKRKREDDKKRTVKIFPEDDTIKIVLDRWGKPSVYYKKKYYRISNSAKPEELSLEQCYEIAGKK